MTDMQRTALLDFVFGHVFAYVRGHATAVMPIAQGTFAVHFTLLKSVLPPELQKRHGFLKLASCESHGKAPKVFDPVVSAPVCE